MSGSRRTRSPNIAVFSKTLDIAGKINKMCLGTTHLRKSKVVSPLPSLLIRKEVDLVPLACKYRAYPGSEFVVVNTLAKW